MEQLKFQSHKRMETKRMRRKGQAAFTRAPVLSADEGIAYNVEAFSMSCSAEDFPLFS
jgi:hypothetical protein